MKIEIGDLPAAANYDFMLWDPFSLNHPQKAENHCSLCPTVTEDLLVERDLYLCKQCRQHFHSEFAIHLGNVLALPETEFHYNAASSLPDYIGVLTNEKLKMLAELLEIHLKIQSPDMEAYPIVMSQYASILFAISEEFNFPDSDIVQIVNNMKISGQVAFNLGKLRLLYALCHCNQFCSLNKECFDEFIQQIPYSDPRQTCLLLAALSSVSKIDPIIGVSMTDVEEIEYPDVNRLSNELVQIFNPAHENTPISTRFFASLLLYHLSLQQALIADVILLSDYISDHILLENTNLGFLTCSNLLKALYEIHKHQIKAGINEECPWQVPDMLSLVLKSSDKSKQFDAFGSLLHTAYEYALELEGVDEDLDSSVQDYKTKREKSIRKHIEKELEKQRNEVISIPVPEIEVFEEDQEFQQLSNEAELKEKDLECLKEQNRVIEEELPREELIEEIRKDLAALSEEVESISGEISELEDLLRNCKESEEQSNKEVTEIEKLLEEAELLAESDQKSANSIQELREIAERIENEINL